MTPHSGTEKKLRQKLYSIAQPVSVVHPHANPVPEGRTKNPKTKLIYVHSFDASTLIALLTAVAG